MSSSEARIDRLEHQVELLLAKVEAQAERIAVLGTENTKLRADNADLRRRLGENSSNSNKPPSSDPPGQREGRRKLTFGSCSERGPQRPVVAGCYVVRPVNAYFPQASGGREINVKCSLRSDSWR